MSPSMSAQPETFAFLLLPRFSIMSLSGVLDPLRAANRLAESQIYDWRIISTDGEPVQSSSRVSVIVDAAMRDVERLPNLIIVTGFEPERYATKDVLGWLRRLDRQGCRMGAVSTGSHILARAGLLDGYRCTIHWENIDSFREAFPDIIVTEEVYEVDRNRFTASGGTAALDMMLGLIALRHGRALATGVAEQFIHERIRDNRDHQRMALRRRLGVPHPKLLAAVELMEQNLEEPLTRAELARRASLSTRQLERLFAKYLNRTPTRYYLELRLARARALLTQTTMPVLDVALACGFVSASHFSKCYRERFNRTPREDRSERDQPALS